MAEEIWKDVVGYENKYQVSNLGRVRSLDRFIKNTGSFGDAKFVRIKGKLLKPRTSKSKGLKTGYYRVLLSGKNYCIHKLVANAFIPNPLKKPQVDHIDCDISNNKVENLKWVTQKENRNNPLTKIKQYKLWYKGEPAVEVAKKNGITKTAFSLRLHYGWSLKEAVEKPLCFRKRKND